MPADDHHSSRLLNKETQYRFLCHSLRGEEVKIGSRAYIAAAPPNLWGELR